MTEESSQFGIFKFLKISLYPYTVFLVCLFAFFKVHRKLKHVPLSPISGPRYKCLCYDVTQTNTGGFHKSCYGFEDCNILGCRYDRNNSHVVLKKIYTFVATPPHKYEQFALLSLSPVISLP